MSRASNRFPPIRKHINSSLPDDITCYKSAHVNPQVSSDRKWSTPTFRGNRILRTQIFAHLWTATARGLTDSSSSGLNILFMTSSTVNPCVNNNCQSLSVQAALEY